MSTLFVTDLDGTLLNGDGRLSARSGLVLAELIGAGHAITLATARSFGTARSAVGELPLAVPLVVSAGAFVVPPRGGDPLRSALLGSDLFRRLRGACDRRDTPPIVFWTEHGVERMSWLRGAESSGVRRFLDDRPGDRRLHPVDGWDEVDASTAFLLSVLGDALHVDGLAEDLAGESCTLALQVDSRKRGGRVLDITGPGATKGVAARWLADRLGHERLVVFGDGPNDLPMFAEADEAYAVANASEQALATATGVIGSNDEDGVAEYLKTRLR